MPTPDVPRPADNSAPESPSSPGRAVDPLLFVVLSVTLAAALAWGLAHAPPVLRRPILSPLAAGTLLGWLSARACAGSGTPSGRRASAFIAVLGCGLVLASHGLTYRALVAAAERRARSHPGDRLGLRLTEEAARGDPEVVPALREQRLELEPTIRDYLTHRISPRGGTAPWPTPVGVLAVEALLCGGAARWVFGNGNARR